MLSHRVLSVASHAYLSEVDPVAPGDAILHAAPMSHGSGLYIMAHVARLGVNVVPESGAFEPEEVFDLIAAWPRSSMFAAPTMIKRLVDCPADCRSRQHPHARVGRRADVRRGHLEGARPLRAAAGADLRPGREPDDDHDARRATTSPAREHPRWRERLASAGRPYACAEVMVADADDRALPVGRERRNPLPRRHGDAAATGATRMPAPRRSGAAGCTPATSASSMPTAISRSRTAPRT